MFNINDIIVTKEEYRGILPKHMWEGKVVNLNVPKWSNEYIEIDISDGKDENRIVLVRKDCYELKGDE